MANGTDAIELVLRALGIGPGDEVIVPSNTFAATAEGVLLAGAEVRFADVDQHTLLLTEEQVLPHLSPRSAAIIPVHLYGHMADMTALGAFAERHHIAIIEDAAQAHGASWEGRKAGAFGGPACFSFYPGKNLGAWGDAGAVVTNDDSLAEKLRSIGNHGRARKERCRHAILGRNSRLDAIQAAVLSAKLKRLDAWNQARREAMEVFKDLTEGMPLSIPSCDPRSFSVYHLNVVSVGKRRDVVLESLRRSGIEAAIHYPVPCHLQDAFSQYARESLPTAETACKEIISLPLWPQMTLAQIMAVCSALNLALDEPL
jgi:dTDP-4-amino-4,6-dideoxygalactose transaminase